MKPRPKTKIYQVTAIFILGLLFLFHSFSSKVSWEDKETLVEKMKDPAQYAHNPLFALIGTVYFLFLLAGVINMVRFLIKRIKKQTLFPSGGSCFFPFDDTERNWRVLSLVFLLPLISNLTSLFFVYTDDTQMIIGQVIIYNFIVEAFTLTILLTNFSPSHLGLTKQCFSPQRCMTLYTSTLLLLIPAVFFNHAVCGLFDIKIRLNPAIPILLSVKSQFFYFLFLVQIIVLGPVAEELFFRGFLFRWIRNKFSFRTSAVFLSSIFAITHRSPSEILPLFLLSLLLCFIYERTHNLWNAIYIHFMHNFLGSLILFALRSYSLI